MIWHVVEHLATVPVYQFTLINWALFLVVVLVLMVMVEVTLWLFKRDRADDAKS